MAVTDLAPRLPGRLRPPPPPGGGSIWLWAAGGIAALVLAPVAALLWQAAQGSDGLWGHLWAYVLAPALGQTVILLAGVGIVVTVLGTTLAWLVAAHDFPGRRLLDWALLLPLAVPSYIIAFVYLEVTHPLGPLQDGLRALLGYASPREFRLPDIRSMPGAILLLGLVLYPYVYLPVRAMFAMQAAGLLEAGRMLGCTRRGLLWRLALPLARPAIAAGASLALMETLNDIGAAEFLGVRTLTVSIYATWVTRSDLPGGGADRAGHAGRGGGAGGARTLRPAQAALCGRGATDAPAGAGAADGAARLCGAGAGAGAGPAGLWRAAGLAFVRGRDADRRDRDFRAAARRDAGDAAFGDGGDGGGRGGGGWWWR
ncbi:ABC transporter permease [Rhodobacter capsulatus]|uniref:ABC transporter permease n=1 Tax=Rhodobacter capsulatus TaxID=1061 RepID=UPI00402654F8